MRTCNDFLTDSPAYLTGSLNEAGAQRLEEHLLVCDACHQRVGDLLHDLLDGASTCSEPRFELVPTAVQVHERTQMPPKVLPFPMTTAVRRLALAAAVLAISGAIGLSTWLSESSTATSMEPPAQTADSAFTAPRPSAAAPHPTDSEIASFDFEGL